MNEFWGVGKACSPSKSYFFIFHRRTLQCLLLSVKAIHSYSHLLANVPVLFQVDYVCSAQNFKTPQCWFLKCIRVGQTWRNIQFFEVEDTSHRRWRMKMKLDMNWIHFRNKSVKNGRPSCKNTILYSNDSIFYQIQSKYVLAFKPSSIFRCLYFHFPHLFSCTD